MSKPLPKEGDQRRMNTSLQRTLMACVLAVALALVAALLAAEGTPAAPPEPITDSFTVEGYCTFPVLFEQTGKVQVHRELPGGVTLVTGHSPTIITNLDDRENQLIVRGSGFAGRITTLENGDALVVATGHNFLFDPGEGIFMTVGRAEFTVAGGPGIGGDIDIRESHGRLVDVCALLA